MPGQLTLLVKHVGAELVGEVHQQLPHGFFGRNKTIVFCAACALLSVELSKVAFSRTFLVTV